MATPIPGIPVSTFYMWRAVFAFALVDNMLSIEEQKLLKVYLDTVPFSDAQRAVLRADFKTPQNVESLYKKITNPADRERFCVLARALVWCEGDMDRQEEIILRRVSCLANGAHDDVLRRTRKHPHLDTYYQHYAKAGVVGMMKISPRFSQQI